MKKQAEPVAPPAPREPTDLVRWKCPDCRITRCGWIPWHDHEPRVCKGIPRNGPTSGICGAIMEEIHREKST